MSATKYLPIGFYLDDNAKIMQIEYKVVIFLLHSEMQLIL